MKNGNVSVVVILTCHNRKEKTVNCVKKIAHGNQKVQFQFIVVDDGSTDGTAEELRGQENLLLKKNDSIHILHGGGNLYWAGGMRKGMLFAKKRETGDFCLLVNDDVDFFEYSIEKMINICHNNIIVGATCDEKGSLTYGGVRYTGRGIRYNKIGIDEADKSCDTFNANCVLIPFEAFRELPVIDGYYVHTLGDFDYGLEMKRTGFEMKVTDFYVGCCRLNDKKGTWNDTSLSRMERVRKKEGVKGAPFRQWFYFLRKNFGWRQAIVHGGTPYLRIAVGR